MFQMLANIFGYLLEFLYNTINNYGLAIILFTVIIKLLLLNLLCKFITWKFWRMSNVI